jgi:hypothetical protein
MKFPPEGLHRIQLAVMPGPLEKLQHQHPHAVSHGAQSRAHGGSGLALAGAGIDQDQSFTGVGHSCQFSVICCQRGTRQPAEKKQNWLQVVNCQPPVFSPYCQRMAQN